MKAEIISKTSDSICIQIKIDFVRSMLQNEVRIEEALNEAGTLASGKALEYFDTEGDPIQIAGVKLTSKGRFPKEYHTPYGPKTIERHVYQTSAGGEIYCPVDHDAHIIITSTPKLAQMISYKYANHGAPQVSADFEKCHGRKIPISFIQHLATMVGSVAQAKEESWSYATPFLDIPVKTIGVGMDGAHILTCDDGWREAMTGTIALYDKAGERLHTTYIGAAPEYGKEKFLERMEREVTRINELYPRALKVGVADGAKTNWEFLSKHTDVQILDFYHTTEYLTKVADSAFAKSPCQREEWLDDACHRLKHEPKGAKTLLEEIKGFRERKVTKANQKDLESTITYFTNNLPKMNYWENLEKNLPIGSGVTEAACKVIIKERLCGSGMRWKEVGAATVIALRCLTRSDTRWEQFWQKIDRYGIPEVNECTLN